MFNHKELVTNHLFLDEHAGILEFCQNFAQNDTTHNWSVVCERTEDIAPVQKQILQNLESIFGRQLDVVGGISFYTLDHLGQSFCATLALSQDQNIRKHLPDFIFKPYVDVLKQEKIVELILNLFHHPAHGGTVAKQILALLDVPLPQDLNLFDAFNNALNFKKKRSHKDISEVFLKQILAVFQASRVVLNKYARLQNLVWDFLQSDVWNLMENDHSRSTLFLPEKFLSGSILWIGAPEYRDSELSTKNFRQGHFLSALVDDFFSIIVKFRTYFQETKDTIFIHNRTVLDVSSMSSHTQQNHALKNISLYSTSTPYEYHQKTQEFAQNRDNSTLVFCGEFNSNMFQTIRSDAGGSYAISTNDVSDWEQGNTENFFSFDIFHQLNTHYDDFLDTVSYIENFKSISDISKIYSIPLSELTDENLKSLFRSYANSETYNYRNDLWLNALIKSFSFFSTKKIPQKLVVLWNARHYVQTSLGTRLLNQVFSFLQSHGVDIDNPFTEKMHSCFWKHIVGLPILFPHLTIDFFVDSKDSLENFPIDLKKKQILKHANSEILVPDYEHFKSFFHESELKKMFAQVCVRTVSTTQFETFVYCPFKFFLEYSLQLRPKIELESFSVDPLELGTRTHKICESILSNMVSEFGNEAYVQEAILIYNTVISALSPPHIFLSSDKKVWENALEVLEKSKKIIFSEAIDEIFCIVDSAVTSREYATALADDPSVSRSYSSDHLASVLFQEMLKRTFIKFLHTEVQIINEGRKFRVGLVREYPFEIKLGALTVCGRIDRVDLNKDGFEIIDYKVSAISKTQKDLCILPTELIMSNTSSGNITPSIQGAIYSLAFGKKVFDNTISNDISFSQNVHESENVLSSFSLYRLKNTSEVNSALLSYSFHAKNMNSSGQHQIKIIENELMRYAENFLNKDFSPNPILKKQTCDYCAYKTVCPSSLSS